MSEFTAGKGIEKFLCIVKPDAEFADDLIAILRDIWIFEFNQTSRGSQHRLIRELPGFVCLAVIQCHLRLEDLSFGAREVEISGRYHFSRALADAHILQAVFARTAPVRED